MNVALIFKLKLNYIFNIYLYVFKLYSIQLSNIHVNLLQKN